MNITVTFQHKAIQGNVILPASKSISNRVLIINALSDSNIPIFNLADCDDTRVMSEVLHSFGNRFDIGHAGTAMRFLTAYLSRIVGCWEITGSERMKQRPVSVLVETLRQLGAKIEYAGQPGCPPLRIYGSLLMGGEIEMEASVSSQYISALMMIAPYMANGLRINLVGNIVSRTYIEMTASIMREFGAATVFEKQTVTIAPVPYIPVVYTVEADWSGASYFYELLAIAGQGEIRMAGLKSGSMQGDACQVEVWSRLGVITRFDEEGVIITGQNTHVPVLEYDFVEMPDLVQSFAVACCVMEIPFIFSGIETLRIKETDRVWALTSELAKLGYVLTADAHRLAWDGGRCLPCDDKIATYHDHRMAMAFAPAALKFPGLVIEDKEVVSKSFPGYWAQLQSFCDELI